MSDDQQPPPGGGGRKAPPAAGGGPRLTKEQWAGTSAHAAGGHEAAGEPVTGAPAGRPSSLVRSRRHKVVGGVCGGLGRYFDLDPVVFRVPLAVLSLIGGLGLVFYGFAWLLVPAEGERENELRRLLSGRVEGTSLSAILVALVGCGLFLASLRSGYTSFSLLVAVGVGGTAYWSQRCRRAEAASAEGTPIDPTTAHAVADAPPETQAPPVPSTPSWWRDPLTKNGTGAESTGYLWGPDEESDHTAGDAVADAALRRRTPRERRSYGGPVFALAQVAALVAGGIALADRSVADSLVIALACALLVYGAAFVVTSFVGKVGGGTLFAVVLTAMGLAAASLLPQDVFDDWGVRRWAPPSAEAVHPYYEQGTGRGTLDLTAVRPGEGETVRTRVRIGAGELRVVVPNDVVVRVDYEVGFGGYRFPDALGDAVREGGPTAGHSAAPDPDLDAVRRPGGGLGVSGSRTLQPADGEDPHGKLLLDLDVGVGEVVVLRKEAATP